MGNKTIMMNYVFYLIQFSMISGIVKEIAALTGTCVTMQKIKIVLILQLVILLLLLMGYHNH